MADTTKDRYIREAERLLTMAHKYSYGDGADPAIGLALATEAKAYAALAQAVDGTPPAEDHRADAARAAAELAKLRRIVAMHLHAAHTSSSPAALTECAEPLLAKLVEAGIDLDPEMALLIEDTTLRPGTDPARER